MRICGSLLCLPAILCVFANPAHAGPITVDGFIFPGDASNPGAYSASASMSWDNTTNTLTLQLANTSTGLQSETAYNLLTGLAFKLPCSVGVLSGSAVMGSVSDAVGFDPVDGTDVSKEWGFDSQPLDSGAFQNTAINSHTDLNTAVATTESQTTSPFALGSLGNPPNFDGPDFGLLSTVAYPVHPGSLSGGVEAIWGGLTVELQLSDLDISEAYLLAFIDEHDVVASFGSPSVPVPVPEPGALALLGFGLVALGVLGRRSNA